LIRFDAGNPRWPRRGLRESHATQRNR
jgi:hypothetical protein